MLITAIKPQERSQLRENIYINGKFGFALAIEIRFESKLKVGQEISENQLKELVFRDQVLKLLSSVQKFLAVRPRSEKEIREKLKTKLDKSDYSEPDKIISEVLNKLRKYDFIDDESFTRWWIEQRQKGKPRGERVLRSELYAKGVHREIIDQIFYKYETPLGEIDKVAAKKLNSYKELPEREFRAKMGAYLARRGYDWDEIRQATNKLLKNK